MNNCLICPLCRNVRHVCCVCSFVRCSDNLSAVWLTGWLFGWFGWLDVWNFCQYLEHIKLNTQHMHIQSTPFTFTAAIEMQTTGKYLKRIFRKEWCVLNVCTKHNACRVVYASLSSRWVNEGTHTHTRTNNRSNYVSEIDTHRENTNYMCIYEGYGCDIFVYRTRDTDNWDMYRILFLCFLLLFGLYNCRIDKHTNDS